MLSSHVFFFMLLSLKPLALGKIKVDCNLERRHSVLQDNANSDPSCSMYRSLAKDLLNHNRNFYNLQNVFFPPNGSNPVFVTVRYHSDDKTTIFFWSSVPYFFYHPVYIFQFTSLLFSDTALEFGEVDLFLSANYSNANKSCMVLLTQRLKLYAMYQKVRAPIDDKYTASAHSALNTSLDNNIHTIGDIAISSQVLLPVFATIYIALFFIFVLELEPYNLSKKLQNELESNNNSVKAQADSRLLTKFIGSSLFHIFTLCMDTAALVNYRDVPNEILDYYCHSLRHFWAVPIAMTAFDSATFVSFIIIPPIVAVCKKKSYLLTYTLISPLSCIASHSYHIVFAFIINPYHATSILLLYAIITFVHILAFQKLFYFINKLISGDACSCCHIKNICGQYSLIVSCFIVEFILMAISISLSIALIIKLPFSKAIDDVPNHLYIIYQASVTFFAALIAFQVLFRQTNSAFDVFIKAEDANIKEAKKKEMEDIELSDVARDNAKDWTDLSEKEKEIYLANLVISFLKSGAELANALKVQQCSNSEESTPTEGAGETESGGPGVENQPQRVDITAEVCDIDIDQHPLILQTTTSN